MSALGLPESTTEREIVDAIAQLKARQPAGTPDGDVAKLVAELAKAKNANTAERIRGKVDDAIANFQLLPYLKDWALRTCAADEHGFDVWLGSIGSPFAHLRESTNLPGIHPSRFGLDMRSRQAELIADQLGVDPKKLAGEE